ncbi:zinc carboxypeptidase A 1-like [Anticarsia gemmatalis]|uniref:zinc carboxypeptidase A 1-like n=1 Tax=Anticarsia gemmatalis TaxID=129554 RepID=UPI003F77426A
MLKYLLLGLILVLPNVLCEKFRFDNYTLYKIVPKNVDQINLLQKLQENDFRFDFWTDPVPSTSFVNILSSPGNKGDLENFMKNNNLDYEVTMPNIQEVIDKEVVGAYSRNNINSMQWDRYYQLDGINAWLDDVVASYPNVATLIIGGTTIEGRDIRGIKISHGAGRRAIFIEGGIHSREFISPATVNFIIKELLTSDDDETKAAARDFDWYIFPVTNPDGYIWAHEHFRLWRKNRRPIGEHVGVDLNRNWNNNWLMVGASTDPASDHYAGTGPFSEPETRTLSAYIEALKDKMDLYISFHSYRELLMIPFGNSTQNYANYDDALKIGRRAMGALSVRFGTQYITGNIAEVIYEASGSSVDWVKEELKTPLVYAYELRDKGHYAFLLPPEQILPNNLEVMDSLIEMIFQAKRFGYMNNAYGIQNDVRYDFWSDPVPSAPFVSILSSPGNKGDLENFMRSNNMDFEVPMSNIQEAIDKEVVGTYTRSNVNSMLWDRYYELDAINAWIDDLVAAYPNIVAKIIGGATFEGREIVGLKISHGEGRKVIFLEGGIHSREWISPATVNFITKELLTSDDEETKAAARDYDWYIFPVTNPDGYIWTHTNFRMWRKNRRPIGQHFGVDLNRNWNNNWLLHGSSTNPALDTYAGLGPFSEPETRTLSAYISSISDRIDLYLSFHSFSELLLLPFGNTTEPLANYHDAMKIGRRAMGALSVRYGTQYVTGNIAEAIYQATGGSVDWVKESLQVPLVYCYELRDKGTYGFLLPPEQILPNNLEVMDSILEIIFQAKRFGYMKTSSAFSVQSSVVLIVMAVLARFL